jgi:pimeloyl-ACP methyl ester carboxylesterase
MTWPVARWGDGDGTALLVHGLSSSKEGWWRVGPALADLGYTVVAPDLRRHGEAPASGSMSIDQLATDLLGLGERWDVVLGHSLGGAAVVRATVRHPSWAGRLVLEDPALVMPDPDAARAILLADFEHPLTGVAQERLNPTWHPTDCEIKAEALEASGPEVVEAAITDNPDWNVVAETASLDVPTLVVGADPERGALVPPALGTSLEDLNDRLTYARVAGGSHSMHRDELDAFLEVVTGWLGRWPTT